METKRATVRVAETKLSALENVLIGRPILPGSRAQLVEEILALCTRIFDPRDQTLLATKTDLESFRERLLERADREVVSAVRAAVEDLFSEEIEIERSLDGQYYTVRRPQAPESHARIPSSKNALAGVRFQQGATQ